MPQFIDITKFSLIEMCITIMIIMINTFFFITIKIIIVFAYEVSISASRVLRVIKKFFFF